jgi:hypothetical protein
MKLLIVQCSPASYYFIPLRFKYSPRNPIKLLLVVVVLLHIYTLHFSVLNSNVDLC